MKIHCAEGRLRWRVFCKTTEGKELLGMKLALQQVTRKLVRRVLLCPFGEDFIRRLWELENWT